MEEIPLSTQLLGNEAVQAIAISGTGGSFKSRTGPPEIRIGTQQDFEETMAIALHESMEFAMDRISCRFDPTNDWGEDHASYIFLLTHPQFSDCINKAAFFCERIRDDLFAAWQLFNPERHDK